LARTAGMLFIQLTDAIMRVAILAANSLMTCEN
jgi:hypothetical protein